MLILRSPVSELLLLFYFVVKAHRNTKWCGAWGEEWTRYNYLNDKESSSSLNFNTFTDLYYFVTRFYLFSSFPKHHLSLLYSSFFLTPFIRSFCYSVERVEFYFIHFPSCILFFFYRIRTSFILQLKRHGVKD